MRTSSLRAGMPGVAGSSLVSSTRSSRGCTVTGSSATSSRYSVPWWAEAKAPSGPNRSRSAFSVVSIAQSTTLKGPKRRAEWACTARAASSLPVPVSPSSSRVESSRARRRSSAKTMRMASEAPTSSPKLSPPSSSSSVSRSLSLSDSRVLPSAMRSPGSTMTCSTMRVSMKVPLRLLRSRSTSPRRVRSISRCLRLTVLSVRTRSLVGSEPTRTSPSSVVYLRPLSGPATTSTVHSRTGIRVRASPGMVTDSVVSMAADSSPESGRARVRERAARGSSRPDDAPGRRPRPAGSGPGRSTAAGPGGRRPPPRSRPP